MGSNLILELIEEVLEILQVPGSPMGFEETFPKATRSLKRDGFTIDGTKLRCVLPETVSLPAADDEVHALLREFIFTTPAGHLDQAIQAHTRGDWAAANSQLRTFVEALFDSIAHKLAPTEARLLTSSHSRRELLASLIPPFLLSDLNEWEIGGAGSGFIQGFWKRLHPAGSHPGLSDEDDCTFRLHVVILVTAMLLRRLKSRPVPP